jgi:hypothetical protein
MIEVVDFKPLERPQVLLTESPLPSKVLHPIADFRGKDGDAHNVIPNEANNLVEPPQERRFLGFRPQVGPQARSRQAIRLIKATI